MRLGARRRENGSDVESAEHWAVDDRSGAALPLPPGWEQVVPAPPGAAVAVALSSWSPAPAVADCRPNVVLTAAPADGVQDVTLLGTAAVAQALASADGAHVLAYDLWAPVAGRPEGRRLCFAYQQEDLGIYVNQLLIVHDGVCTAVTGTCGVDVADVLAPVLDAVGAAVRLPRGAGA